MKKGKIMFRLILAAVAVSLAGGVWLSQQRTAKASQENAASAPVAMIEDDTGDNTDTRPTDETVIVYSSEQSEPESEPSSSDSEAPDDTHEEESSEPYSEEPPADSQEDIDRQNQNIANQNSQAQQGNPQKLPKTFAELPDNIKKIVLERYMQDFNCTEAEAIEMFNSVSRETTSNNLGHGGQTGGSGVDPLWK